MTDRTLLGLSDEPAELVGYGPIPVETARAVALVGADETADESATEPVKGDEAGAEEPDVDEASVYAVVEAEFDADELDDGQRQADRTGARGQAAHEATGRDRAADRADAGRPDIPAPHGPWFTPSDDGAVPRWMRRLYADPSSGELITMDSPRRCFTPAQRRFIRLRDRVCRTPFCGAPIRHTDHVDPAGNAGPTSVSNGQGLCQACNHAKQASGWSSRVEVGPSGRAPTIEVTTPTGHRYRSRSPSPPGFDELRGAATNSRGGRRGAGPGTDPAVESGLDGAEDRHYPEVA